eukprot:GFUD01008377.1.p1 GENE.GFUD01008377.1~~GFUD01008377.1.p1  ORF type:complete len:131 (+),score=9.93 GFUD01008377.1:53-445(+)
MGNQTSNTHVANRTGDTIYAEVRADHQLLTGYSYSRSDGKGNSASGSGGFDWELCDKKGFTMIPHGRYHKFHEHGDKGRVYINVLRKTGCGGKYELLASARPTENDRSIIVEKDGHIVDSRYGTIWQADP